VSDFTEVHLMGLFSKRHVSKFKTAMGVMRGIAEIASFAVDYFRSRRDPRRVEDILGKPLDSEKLRNGEREAP
jgi:hypothetical protein